MRSVLSACRRRFNRTLEDCACNNTASAVQAYAKQPYLYLLQVLLQFSGLFMLCTDLNNLHSSTMSPQPHDCKCAESGLVLSCNTIALWTQCTLYHNNIGLGVAVEALILQTAERSGASKDRRGPRALHLSDIGGRQGFSLMHVYADRVPLPLCSSCGNLSRHCGSEEQDL